MAAKKSTPKSPAKPTPAATPKSPAKPKPAAKPKLKSGPARNAELEAVIDRDPSDPNGYLVYADWLQQQGDCRGELVALQQRRDADPDNEAVADEEARFIRRHEKELLGPLARYAFIRTVYRTMPAFGWRFGFLRKARIRRVSMTPLPEILARILEHPAGRFLETLVVGRPSFGDNPGPLADIFAVLAAKAPPTFRRLILGDDVDRLADVSSLWSALPALRDLSLLWPPDALGVIRADALESLAVSLHASSSLEPYVRASLPALRRLTVTLSVTSEEHDGVALLAPLESPAGFPRLEMLHVRQWAVDIRERPIVRDRIAAKILPIAIARGVRHLRLDVPFSGAGVDDLLRRAGDFGGRTLELASEGIPPPLHEKVVAAFPKLVWSEASFDAEEASVDLP